MRIDEIYLSVQGEGPRVGMPTVFVRTGGCNLRCPGWPCDTQHAIQPAFRKNWTEMKPGEIFTNILDVAEGNRVNVCLTGGEPFLQSKDEIAILLALCESPLEIGVFECFSNGTLPYKLPNWAIDDIHFIMDWKLPGSGEDHANETRLQNLHLLSHKDSVKFVIKDLDDLDVAATLWSVHLQHKSYVQVFYGAVWGAIENSLLVAEVLRRQLPWRLNMQMHNYIWDRTQRGI